MAFVFKKSRNPNAGRELIAFTLTSVETFTVGQSVKLTSGKLTSWAGTGVGCGIIAGFVKANGAPVTDNGDDGDFTGSYLTPAANTVKALVDVSLKSVYSCAADATLGTTNDSDYAGINIDAATGGLTLDESSAEVVGTTGAFVSFGEDPDSSAPSNSLLVSIQESQIKI